MQSKKFVTGLPVLVLVTTLACSIGPLAAEPTQTPIPPTLAPPTAVPATATPIQPTEAPTPTFTPSPAGPVVLDPCTLMTSADAEVFFAQPAGQATNSSGSCVFMNSDSLYTVSLAAAQGRDQLGIYQGQFILFGFSGGTVDEATQTRLKLMAESGDASGFFGELVSLTAGSSKVKTALLENTPFDMAYWSWFSVDTRNQASLVVTRDGTMINLNMVVPASQPEATVQSAALTLAERIAGQLPVGFTLNIPSTAIPDEPTPAPTDTASVLPAPHIISPENNKVFDEYPRNLTLDWDEVPGAAKYEIELLACDQMGENCFDLLEVHQLPKETNGTIYSLEFVGAQPGKWRVRAVDAAGVPGEWSSWWGFRYTK